MGIAKGVFSMKNTIKFWGVIALVAVIVFSMAACKLEEEDPPIPTTTNIAEQTVITVTGLEAFNGKYAYAGISMSGYSGLGLCLPQQITATGSMTFEMIDENLKMVSVSGSCTVILIITETSEPKSTSYFEGVCIKSLSKGTTTIPYDNFTDTKK
jgi:hypothetical protein